jgi:hypothetical protein
MDILSDLSAFALIKFHQCLFAAAQTIKREFTGMTVANY